MFRSLRTHIMKINENSTVTLTLGQLKRLVKESSDELLERQLVDFLRERISVKVSQWEENAPELALPAGMEDTLAQDLAEALMSDWDIAPLEGASYNAEKYLAETTKRPSNHFAKRCKRRVNKP